MNSREFFWLHLRKCGGTSCKKLLGKHYIETKKGNQTLPFIATPKPEWNALVNTHGLPLGQYDNRRMLFAKTFLYTEEEFAKMYKFTIVRNPYDRAVSAWKYLHKNDAVFSRKTIFNPGSVLRKYSFEKFLENLPRVFESKDSRHYYSHTLPMLPDLCDLDNSLLVDDWFKLEEIELCTKKLNSVLGIELGEFPHSNKNRNENGYRKYYNSKTRALVEQLYGDDISFFGYNF